MRLRFTSNAAAEIHVHGYDSTKDVPTGGTARFRFKATIEGIFEVEVHGTASRSPSSRSARDEAPRPPRRRGGAAALSRPTRAAHGIVGRQDLPIPRWLFAWAATRARHLVRRARRAVAQAAPQQPRERPS